MRDVTEIFIRAFARPVWRTGTPVQGADEPSSAWSRFGPILKIGAWLVSVGGVALAVNAFGRMPSTAPIELTHTVSFSQFGLQVVLPSSWKVDSGPGGAEFSAAHSATGAKLVGAVTVSNPPAPDLDAVIDRVIQDARARVGALESISRGVMGVGATRGALAEDVGDARRRAPADENGRRPARPKHADLDLLGRSRGAEGL